MDIHIYMCAYADKHLIHTHTDMYICALILLFTCHFSMGRMCYAIYHVLFIIFNVGN